MDTGVNGLLRSLVITTASCNRFLQEKKKEKMSSIVLTFSRINQDLKLYFQEERNLQKNLITLKQNGADQLTIKKQVFVHNF